MPMRPGEFVVAREHRCRKSLRQSDVPSAVYHPLTHGDDRLLPPGACIGTLPVVAQSTAPATDLARLLQHG
jgi:hypothetical protein